MASDLMNVDGSEPVWELFGAITSGDIKLVDAYFANHSDYLALTGLNGYSFLHHCIQEGRLDILVSLLKREGVRALLDQFDQIGNTPLHYACEEGRVEIVRELLNAGANVNSADESKIGNTPLAEAVDAGAVEIVKILLSAGARPEIKGWMQLDAIDRARENAATNANQNASEILKLLETLKEQKK